MPAQEINPFTALTRIRYQFLRTQLGHFKFWVNGVELVLVLLKCYSGVTEH